MFALHIQNVSHGASLRWVMLTPSRCLYTPPSHPSSQPDFFLPDRPTAPSSTAPRLSSFAQTPTEPSFPAGSSPHTHQSSVLFSSGNLGQRITDLETFKMSPSSHTRHTYACPRVHTQWIFSFNEAICPVPLAPFPLLYTEGHKHTRSGDCFQSHTVAC